MTSKPMKPASTKMKSPLMRVSEFIICLWLLAAAASLCFLFSTATALLALAILKLTHARLYDLAIVREQGFANDFILQVEVELLIFDQVK